MTRRYDRDGALRGDSCFVCVWLAVPRAQYSGCAQVYKAYGRMFLLSSKSAVCEQYTADVKKAEERLTVMVNTQAYLERQMEDCQTQLTELSMANPTGARCNTVPAPAALWATRPPASPPRPPAAPREWAVGSRSSSMHGLCPGEDPQQQEEEQEEEE